MAAPTPSTVLALTAGGAGCVVVLVLLLVLCGKKTQRPAQKMTAQRSTNGAIVYREEAHELTSSLSPFSSSPSTAPPTAPRPASTHGAVTGGASVAAAAASHHGGGYAAVQKEERMLSLVSSSAEVDETQAKEDLAGWAIERSDLTIQAAAVLGKGFTGDVLSGMFKGTSLARDAEGSSTKAVPVAIKVLRNPQALSKKERRVFLMEAQILMEFTHPNILGLIGVCIKQDPWYIVTRRSELGDMRTALKRCKDMNVFLNREEILRLGCQVAAGMAYLSAQNFIHRDLAARNCYLYDRAIVKLAHFGRSRFVLQESDYYKPSQENTDSLAMRWMALESIEKQRFSVRSDVWSFGVLLFELYSHAETPYSDINALILGVRIKEGLRPRRPDGCPDYAHALMTRCWAAAAKDRPSFREVYEELSRMYTKEYDALTTPARDLARLFGNVLGLIVEEHDPYHSLTPDHKRDPSASGDDVLPSPAFSFPPLEREREAAIVPGVNTSAPWFHGIMSRAAAENALLSQGSMVDNGSFLIRQSPKAGGQYVLSLMVDQSVWHYRIDVSPTPPHIKFYGRTYDTMDRLIEHHTRTQENLLVPLPLL